MKNHRRLKSGGRVDRSTRLNFTFNGRHYYGFEGDTLASALIANGVKVVARSFKYHRPRGIIGSGIEDPASLVELLDENASGNNLATTVILKDGLKAKSINCWPNVDFDFGSIIQFFQKLVPAGFYYKTFMWPNWHLFEPSIRKAAGLAAAPHKPPSKGHFESRNAHTDILVIGSGPAGLAAALIAAKTGAKVFLVDQNSEPGGDLLSSNLRVNKRPAMAWVDGVVGELAKMTNVAHMQNSTAWAYREHNLVIVNQREVDNSSIIERSWRVRAKKVIIATGAIERSLVFANNDRPGVMLASAVHTFVNRYAVKVGDNLVLFTNNDSVYDYIDALGKAGINILAIIDSRKIIPDQCLSRSKKIKVIANSIIKNVNGYKQVKSIVVQSLDTGKFETISCDLLAHSGGWNPAVHLHSQSRGSLRFSEKIVAFVPDKNIQNSLSIGACNGTFGLAEIFKETEQVMSEISDEFKSVSQTTNLEIEDQHYSIEPLWSTDLSNKKESAFFDIQNDVTYDDVQLALLEG